MKKHVSSNFVHIDPPIVTSLVKIVYIDHLKVVPASDQMKQPIALLCEPEDAENLSHLVGKRVSVVSRFQEVDESGRPEQRYVHKDWLKKHPQLEPVETEIAAKAINKLHKSYKRKK